MNKIELIEVGHTKKPKGIEGLIKIHIEDQYIDDVSNARAIFIDLNGSRVPFLIEKFVEDNQLLIKLDEVDSPQDAEAYSAKTVFLDINEVKEPHHSIEEIHPFVGYEVIDQDNNSRGHITSVEEYPNQLMAFIYYNDSTFMSPIHEDNVIEVSEPKNMIKITIPEGLSDL